MRAFALLVGLLCSGAAFATERNTAIVESFASFCIPGPPDFAAIDAKATAMKLPVGRDVSAPQQQAEQSAHSKSWHVSLDGGGAYDLVAAEIRAAQHQAASCGIGAEGADGEIIKNELTAALKLSPPARETTSADGTQRLTMWNYGDGLTLVLTDGTTPMGAPGLYLSMLYRKDSSR
jgi:hypothetical protein